MSGLRRLDDPPLTILKSSVESQEPEMREPVEGTGAVRTVAWSEEERRNVAAFYTLLDQWDRELNKQRQVA
jgi:hypothetical protein